MGLDLLVGVRAVLEDEDEDAIGEFAAELAVINEALLLAGLPRHEEPSAEPGEEFSCQMFGYRGLHDLRRLALHLAAGDEPTPIGRTGVATDDPLVRSAYEHLPIEPRDEGIYLVNEHAAPGPFDHLLYHSDANGFYVPIDFPRVIVRAMGEFALDVEFGSSVALARECRAIGDWLGIPPDLGYDAERFWRAADDPPTVGPRWERFGIETYGCRCLLEAAERSIERGMLLVFA